MKRKSGVSLNHLVGEKVRVWAGVYEDEPCMHIMGTLHKGDQREGEFHLEQGPATWAKFKARHVRRILEDESGLLTRYIIVMK